MSNLNRICVHNVLPYGWLRRLCKYFQPHFLVNHTAASPICLLSQSYFLLAIKWSEQHCKFYFVITFASRKFFALFGLPHSNGNGAYRTDVSTANKIGTLGTAPFRVVCIIMKIGQMCNCNIIGWILEIVCLRFLRITVSFHSISNWREK